MPCILREIISGTMMMMGPGMCGEVICVDVERIEIVMINYLGI